VYRRLAFGPAFWSFAFPYAAVATFALHWINYGRPVGYRIWA
jgi:tellurite resistance protein